MARNIKELVGQMTLEEKAGMCSGTDFWHLQGVERLGIPAVMVSDGPHGLRKQEGTVDHLGMRASIKAVCFPAACAAASSFDRDLLHVMGEALGDECQAEGISVLLGPAVNIKRSPLCGRNFEYLSEDPCLVGELAAAYIDGLQSRNVGASIKHFAVNNQEYRRMTISAEVDEQALREIYLRGFEIAITQARPWTVMCSYNKINGVFASENKQLLTGILRDEWGFEGYVMSDWGAVNRRVEGLRAGLELEMPSSRGTTNIQIVRAVQDGSLPEAVLDTAVERILNIVFRYADNKVKTEFNREKDHALTVKIEEESAVLLKNENQTLPLRKGRKIAFIGEFVEKPRYQGGGSSHIDPFRVSNALESVQKIPGAGEIVYAVGFRADRDERDESLFAEALMAAERADAAVIFAGLPDSFESEGYDRTHMRLPVCQDELIRAVCGVQKNTVVVLHNGSPVEMPWADQVQGILELYLGGQGVGEAAVRLLFGEANPSGKLAETFPLKLEDNPSYLNFPGTKTQVFYREGIHVGYRYYDKKRMPVRYPFGHGLSYTTFAYSNLRLDSKSLKAGETLRVQVDVTNTGSREGKEVVQLYVRDKTGTPNRPEKELKDFVKLSLAAGETKTAEFILDNRAFAYYHTGIAAWYTAGGDYEILIGKSSQDIQERDTVQVAEARPLPFKADKNTTVSDFRAEPRIRALFEEEMGKFIAQSGEADTAGVSPGQMMEMEILKDIPIRSARNFFGMSEEQLDAIVEKVNRAYSE
ncbi:MAG: glycoside hydrolase family 3 C-terminal domain-containing protein [Spirochaetaceae bacterium]|jgi:beta-glucosidase|nr:glycoside hydrolase family 3 C-terminal domain-containing protein [Spirochaetaceae bacterium]